MKVSEDTIQISKRFFEALDALIVRGDLRGVQTFTDKYGIDYRNIFRAKNTPEKTSVGMVWIAHLARDFGVSAHWVLTGQGKMFVK
jgi:hypothetical protein